MSSSNQRPANRGFRSVLRCAITYYRQFSCLSAPEPSRHAGADRIIEAIRAGVRRSDADYAAMT